VDTPTSYGSDTGAGGEVRGNYATFNPLTVFSGGVALSNGNLSLTNGASNRSAYSTMGVSSGKWYFETTFTSVGSTTSIGIGLLGYVDTTTFIGNTLYSYGYDRAGLKYNNGSSASYGTTYTNNDVIGVALDLDAGTLIFYKNGVSQGTAYSSLPAGIYFLGASSYNSTGSINFGQQPFAYTAPSGYKALCTQNLTTPTIGATSTTTANKYMDVSLYSGTSASQSITNSGSMQPDLVWIKSRSAATDNKLTDAVRGTTKGLISNTTGAETTDTNGLTAFNSNGFTIGSDSVYNNGTGPATYVAWQWNAGGSNATNTSGTITSTVRANTTAGFSIVTYTGNGSAGATVGHGLGVAPSMTIIKRRDAITSWIVNHTSAGTGFLLLEQTAAYSSAATYWTSPATSSLLPTLTSNTEVNANTGTYVAYCFAPVAGYSAFGSYTGTNTTDGPFVYTGFRPRWIMIKITTSGGSATYGWAIFDTARENYNINRSMLVANVSNAEDTTINADFDILSNGFKPRYSANYYNGSGTYIYAAFAESPFKYSLAR